jgi:hypothetical protein
MVIQEVVAEGKAQVQSGFDIQRGLEEDLYAAQSMQVSLLMDTEHQHAKVLEVSACIAGSANLQRRGRPYSLSILNTSMRSWVNARTFRVSVIIMVPTRILAACKSGKILWF